MDRGNERISLAKQMGYTNFESPMDNIFKMLVPGAFLAKGEEFKPAGTVTGMGYIHDGQGGLFDPRTGNLISSRLSDEIRKDFLYSDFGKDVIEKADAAESEMGRDIQKKLAEIRVEEKYENLLSQAQNESERDYITAVRDEVKKEVERDNVTSEGKIRNPFEAARAATPAPSPAPTPAPETREEREERETVTNRTSNNRVINPFEERGARGGSDSGSQVSSGGGNWTNSGGGRFVNKGGYIDKQMEKSGLTPKK